MELAADWGSHWCRRTPPRTPMRRESRRKGRRTGTTVRDRPRRREPAPGATSWTTTATTATPRIQKDPPRTRKRHCLAACEPQPPATFPKRMNGEGAELFGFIYYRLFSIDSQLI